MEASEVQLLKFINRGGTTLFKIPVYQRNYEWNIDQCRQLFGDLVQTAKTGRKHFLGTIVYVYEPGENGSDIYEVIDGQQRLITVMLLLKALGNADTKLKDRIRDLYLYNKYFDINNSLKLEPVKYDNEAFYDVMEDQIDDNTPASKIVENYKFFQDQITNTSLSAKKLFDALYKFNIVYIQLTNNIEDENPQVIFESLNSTGVTLTSIDLVRNFLFMNLNSKEQSRLYEKYWLRLSNKFTNKELTEFLRFYLILKEHKVVNKSNVYSTYKNFYKQEGLNSEEALDDLYKFAMLYDNLNHAKLTIGSQQQTDEINRIVNHINIMQTKVVYPYFMMLINLFQQKHWNIDQLISLLYAMEGLCFRLKICQCGTSGMNGIIATLCQEYPLDELKENEDKKIAKKIPDNSVMDDQIPQYKIYHKSNQNQVQFTRLTLFVLEENKSKESIEFGDKKITIDHIMPQTLTSSWRLAVSNADKVNEDYGDTLGNLTLTGYNPEMSNKDFNEKEKYYTNSNISITREIPKKYSKWNRETITKRSRYLAKQLERIYPMPDIKVVARKKHGIYELTQVNMNVTGRKPNKIILDGKVTHIKTWKEALVLMLNHVWNLDSRNLSLLREHSVLNKNLFSRKKINSPSKLENGEIIETNYSANGIASLLHDIAEICHVKGEINY